MLLPLLSPGRCPLYQPSSCPCWRYAYRIWTADFGNAGGLCLSDPTSTETANATRPDTDFSTMDSRICTASIHLPASQVYRPSYATAHTHTTTPTTSPHARALSTHQYCDVVEPRPERRCTTSISTPPSARPIYFILFTAYPLQRDTCIPGRCACCEDISQAFSGVLAICPQYVCIASPLCTDHAGVPPLQGL